MSTILSSKGLSHWLPAVASMVCQGIAMGVFSIIGFFVVPMATALDASVAALSSAPAIMVLASAVLAPRVGRWLDRTVIKWVMCTGVVLSMGSLMLLSQVQSLAMAALVFASFSAGIVLCGPMVNNTLLTKLYAADLGRALGIAAMGLSICAIVLPLFVASLLESFGWRAALQILGGSLMLLMLAAVISLVPAAMPAASEPSAAEQPQASAAGFRSRPEFWLIGIAVALAFGCPMILGISFPAHLEHSGFALDQAALLIASGGVGGIIGKLLVATAADRLKAKIKWLGIFFVAAIIAGVMLLQWGKSFAELLPAFILIGFGGGGLVPLHPYLNSAYFESKNIGAINGAQMPLFLPLTLIGPPLIGWSFDRYDSYLNGYLAIAMIAALSAALLLCLRTPAAD